MRVYHRPYRRLYRHASSAGQLIRFCLWFVTHFISAAWGARGSRRGAPRSPCPHAVPRQPLVPRRPGTLAKLATPWGQGLTPLHPANCRGMRPSVRTPRSAGRQAASSAILCLILAWTISPVADHSGQCRQTGVHGASLPGRLYLVPPSSYDQDDHPGSLCRLAKITYPFG
jgi:hypothetical protein